MARPRVRDDLSDLVGYHSPQVNVDVRLNTNEAPAGPPPEFAEALAGLIASNDWNRYPDRSARTLRTALGRRFGLGVEEVFCANGSNEVLQTVLLTFAGAGRTTLTFEPTYALHSHLSRISGATNIMVDRSSDFTLDIDDAVRAVAENEPAVTFICSPNNPTGLVESRDNVVRLLGAVSAVNGLLVIDEAYGEFSTWSAVDLLADDVPAVVVKTYSKMWAMAGARLGYLLGPAWIVERLEQVVLPYHLDSLKQAAGLVALDFVETMDARVATIKTERERLEQALADLGCQVWPSGANFILFRPRSDGDDAGADRGIGEDVWHQLVESSVLVRNTSSWDRLEGCLRVTVGTAQENDQFLSAIGAILSKG